MTRPPVYTLSQRIKMNIWTKMTSKYSMWTIQKECVWEAAHCDTNACCIWHRFFVPLYRCKILFTSTWKPRHIIFYRLRIVKNIFPKNEVIKENRDAKSKGKNPIKGKFFIFGWCVCLGRGVLHIWVINFSAVVAKLIEQVMSQKCWRAETLAQAFKYK